MTIADQQPDPTQPATPADHQSAEPAAPAAAPISGHPGLSLQDLVDEDRHRDAIDRHKRLRRRRR